MTSDSVVVVGKEMSCVLVACRHSPPALLSACPMYVCFNNASACGGHAPGCHPERAESRKSQKKKKKKKAQ
jgi:hypothetical protein